MDEERSRPIHFHTVVWVWSLASLLSLWRIPIRFENLWLLVIQPTLMCLCAYGSIPLAKWIGCTRAQVGVIAVAAGVGNHGFTLGSYLCYVMINPPQQGLAYATAYAMATNIAVVVLIFPMVRRFSTRAIEGGSVGRMIVSNFVDLRALPMYAAMVGVGLAATGVPFPGVIDDWGLLDVIFYVGGFGGYLGIGLRLRLGDSRVYLRQHVLLGVMKLAVMPIAGLGIVWMISHTAYPMEPILENVVWIQSMAPSAIITVMIANVFHLDPRMASVAWVWNTLLFAAISLPIILWTMG